MEEAHKHSTDVLPSIPPALESTPQPLKVRYVMFGVITTVLVLVIGTSGFLLGYHKNSTHIVQVAATPTPLATPTIMAVVTVKPPVTITPIVEKTYTDADFGYSISYPKSWILRHTYGKDIQKATPTDILSGIDLTYNTMINGQPNAQATIVVNVLAGHGLSDVQTWISQYDLNYPKNATKTQVVFNGYNAIKYAQADDGTGRVYAYIYFLAKGNAYRIAYWEEAGISSLTEAVVNTFKP